MEKEQENMEYVDKLLQETEFLQLLERLEQLEQKREFCRHGLTHLLDTAKIAWIRVLEQGQEKTNKETVYLAALLHDLGRIREYEDGIPHHEAGAVLAAELLDQIGYPKEKAELIRSAVAEHRRSSATADAAGGQDSRPAVDAAEGLRELLTWADKKSRNCFCCKAQESCRWEQEKRNDTLEY